MEARYQRAIKTGLMCGLVIAVIYLIGGLAGVWLNSTPAMTAYTEKVAESVKNNLENPQSHTVLNLPQPPVEYYVNMVLSLIVLGAEIIGLLLAGALALAHGTQAKYTSKDAVYTGAISGAAAYVPIFAAMVVITLITTLLGSTINTLTATMPSSVTITPVIAILASLFGLGCCCLPIGAVVSAVLGGIGALGYALSKNRRERQGTAPSP